MAGSANKKPNIIVVYPDQLRADSLHCAGNDSIKTPFVDRLASEGVRFDQAYTHFPLCTPFRASLFTGKYSHSTGVYANHHPIPTGQDFLAEILAAEGYETGYVGKWHLEGGPAPGFVPPGERRLGFRHFVGFNRGHYYFDNIYYRDSEQPYHSPRYEPDFQTDHLIDFMEECVATNPNHPFFATICYGAPHFPLTMPEYFSNLYDPSEVPLGPTAGDVELQKKVRRELEKEGFPAASGLWGSGDAAAREYDDETAVRKYLAKYYGMIANVDHNVGRLLNWLDKKGLHDDTVVVFLSDHGDMAGEHGYRCGTKRTPYKQAMQVPLIVRYPRRIPAGKVADALVDVGVDTMPTLLDLCGLDLPGNVQGTSYLPVLDDPSTHTREAVFYEVDKELEGPERAPVPYRGVRTTDWLYARNPDEPKLLIDLKNDPDELCNLVSDPTHQSDIQRLDEILQSHMEETGDDWSAEAIFPPEGFLSHEEKSEKQKTLLKNAIIEP